jgi:hypothetical protein
MNVPRVSIEQHTHPDGRVELMARHDAPHPVTLPSAMENLSPTQAERMRRRALSALRTAKGKERQRWSQALLLADSRLGHEAEPSFEDRLQLAREAIGRAPSREDEQIQQQAAAVRLSMQGGPTQPDVAARARAVRARMEGTERDLPFERRLAAAKASLGRS